MAGPRKFTQEQIIAAVTETKGMVAVAARRLHCESDTIRNYAKRYPAVAAAIKEERQMMGDIAELGLFKAIQNGDLDAIKFYLKTVGKDRGYVERVESTGADGGPIEVADVSSFTDSERAERVTALLDLGRARRARSVAGSLDTKTASDTA